MILGPRILLEANAQDLAGLIPRTSIERMKRCLAVLPHTPGLILEFPLAGRPRAADLTIWLSEPKQGREMSKLLREACLMKDPGWRHTARTVECWAGRRRSARESHLFFEFDLPPDRDLPRDRRSFDPPGVGFNTGGFGSRAVLNRIEALHPGRMGRETRTEVQRILRHPGAYERLVHAGVMSGRRPPVVKLFLSLEKTESPGTFLQGLGWPGDLDRVEDFLEPLRTRCEARVVDVAVGPAGVSPHFGMECYPVKAKPTRLVPQWRRSLDRLVEAGLCPEKKAERLGAWPRLDRIELLAQLGISRSLNHIKLVVDEHGRGWAKAYINLFLVWAGPVDGSGQLPFDELGEHARLSR